MPDPEGRKHLYQAGQDLSRATPIDVYNSTAEVIPFEQAQDMYDQIQAAGRVTRLTALEGKQ